MAFDSWLREKLRELNTDESVFGNYIIGILEGEETQDEKRDALEGILGETGSTNLEELISTIFTKWFECHSNDTNNLPKKIPEIDVNAQLAKLLEQQRLLPTTIKERQLTDEERRVKEQILAQYSQTEVEDLDAYDSDGENEKPAASSTSGLERNTNKEDVAAMHRERREQARQESAAKKQKDRDDREKQKQLREEKKEKRKTVKGERRR